MLLNFLKNIRFLYSAPVRRIVFRVTIFCCALLFILLWIANQTVASYRKFTYDRVEDIPYNRVAVVLGTSKYLVGGGLNGYFQNRIDATASLYLSGKVSAIIVSGDNATLSYNEPREMRRELIKRGIPAKDIYSDYAGFRTLDSILRAHGVFGQNRFTVVSQRFQNERAIYLAKHHNIDVIGLNAVDVDLYTGFKTRVREYFARLWCLFDIYLWEREPKFMGEPIEVE